MRKQPVTFADVGIFNREGARRAGVRTPKKRPLMAVPKGKKR